MSNPKPPFWGRLPARSIPYKCDYLAAAVGRDLWRERLAGEFFRAPEESLSRWIAARLEAAPEDLLFLTLDCASQEWEMLIEDWYQTRLAIRRGY